MRFLLVNGSHRKGNTQFILQSMKSDLQATNSHKVNLINLCEKNIQFCNESDYNCKKTLQCQSCCRDDMKQIYPLLQQADVIVLGSPMYFSNVSARMKNLMDRCNPYYFNQKLKGKYMVVVGVGQSENNKQFFDAFKKFAEALNLRATDFFYALGDAPDMVKKDQKVIQQLKQFTKLSLVSGSKLQKKVKA